ncbi:hypothetical protein PR048_029571 [Dryococelus australis]|uniref:Transposase n=1 Tax=Dryococelus australis TaxID=614101 RepID=A0ABQ9GDR3_9NEOP|nr:hypothetical protein PR048_029571 [Dryococelus australis]
MATQREFGAKKKGCSIDGGVPVPHGGHSFANIAATQEAFLRSSGKSTRRNSAECGIPQTTVWRILNKDDLGMQPYHLQAVQELSPADEVVRVYAFAVAGVVGSYFFENDIVTGADVLLMLETYVADDLSLRILLTGYFQLDGAPPHFARVVRNYLDAIFHRRWIGRGDHRNGQHDPRPYSL